MNVIRDRRKIENTVCDHYILRGYTRKIGLESTTLADLLDPAACSTRLNTLNRDRRSEICVVER